MKLLIAGFMMDSMIDVRKRQAKLEGNVAVLTSYEQPLDFNLNFPRSVIIAQSFQTMPILT